MTVELPMAEEPDEKTTLRCSALTVALVTPNDSAIA